MLEAVSVETAAAVRSGAVLPTAVVLGLFDGASVTVAAVADSAAEVVSAEGLRGLWAL